MTRTPRTIALLLASLAVLPLSACSGTGGGGAATSHQAASGASSALIVTVAKAGPTPASSGIPMRGGVLRTSREGRGREGGTVVTNYDHPDGIDGGLVTTIRGRHQDFSTRTAPGLSPRAVSGSYYGTMEVSFRSRTGQAWEKARNGEADFSLDARTGEVAGGGIAESDRHIVELFWDAKVVNGKMTSTDFAMHLRDDQGRFITGVEGGSLTGRVVHQGRKDGGYGTFHTDQSNTQGFIARGGFVAMRDPHVRDY